MAELKSFMQGNCSSEVEGTLQPPLGPNQCLVLLTEDFLEADLDEDSHVWVSGLYIKYDVGLAEEKNHTTVLKSAHSNLYLTDLTLVAEGSKARAVDVKENQTVFVAGVFDPPICLFTMYIHCTPGKFSIICINVALLHMRSERKSSPDECLLTSHDRLAADSHFENFQKDKDGVMRVSAGGRATVVNCSFHRNTVSTGLDHKIAAGPVMGLKTWTGSYNYTKGSAAWFTDCEYSDSVMAVPGEVSVEDSNSSVFTNQALPTIWHRNNSEEIRALTVAESRQGGQDDVFANVSARLGPFLRPDNLEFRELVADQARATGMPPAVISQLPLGTDLVLIDPPSLDPASDDASLSTGAVAGIVATALLALISCIAAVLAILRRRKLKAKKAAVRTRRFSIAPLSRRYRRQASGGKSTQRASHSTTNLLIRFVQKLNIPGHSRTS